MTRLILVLGPVLSTLAIAGCFQAHPMAQEELMGSDCYACHRKDYVATTAPVHPDTPQLFSTGCATCHRTSGWKPALDGLHNEAFIIAQGPHAAPITCVGCHELDGALPSKAGANTNCIQCHPNDAHQADSHVGLLGLTGAPYAYLSDTPNFCLSCHPAGTAEHHPDALFALRKDHAVPCASCHDRAAGPDTKGANVTCVDARCHHTLSASDQLEHHLDAAYRTARGPGTIRAFCHQCHS
jgi:hypothetical protein